MADEKTEQESIEEETKEAPKKKKIGAAIPKMKLQATKPRIPSRKLKRLPTRV